MDLITFLTNKMPRTKKFVERTFPFIGKTMNARRERMRVEAYKAYGMETARQFNACMTDTDTC